MLQFYFFSQKDVEILFLVRRMLHFIFGQKDVTILFF